MIPPKVQALFRFIDFLDSNKPQYIDDYLPLVKLLEELNFIRNSNSLSDHYTSRIKVQKAQSEIDEKFPLLYDNVTVPIQNRLKKLKIWDGDDTFTSIHNLNVSAIESLKRDFETRDIQIINKYKVMYLDFRIETNSNFLSLQFLFNELDELLKNLFDYFSDAKKNEFKPFETKTIVVDNIAEAVKGLQKGQAKFTLPNSVLENQKSKLVQGLNEQLFFQIYFETDSGKEKNNESKVTPENWNERKETFYKQRLETHPASYTESEKIKLELEALEITGFVQTDNNILKERYKTFLSSFKEQLNRKLKIAVALIGENNTNTTSVVYHHIPAILNRYSITNIQGKDILLTMEGAFSPLMKKNVLKKIIAYLKEVDFKPKTSTFTIKEQTLSTLITHKKNIEVIDSIKVKYKNIKGKRLKLLLMALQALELLPKERIASKFHKYCKLEFDWDIASYNAMNGHIYNDRADREELEEMKTYLNDLIKDN